MIKVGDRIRVVKDIADYFCVGDVLEVTDIVDKIIIIDGDFKTLFIPIEVFEKYFEVVKNISVKDIAKKIFQNSTVDSCIVMGDLCVVSCRLPSGNVIIEKSYFYGDYIESINECFDKIVSKIATIEEYKIKNR